MDKREAKRQACSFLVDLIASTQDMAPFSEYAEEDAQRLDDALEELRQEMARRCGRGN